MPPTGGFHFVYQACPGDLEVVVRVLSQDATDPWAKAGLMSRQGLAPGAPHVLVAVTPEHGVNLVRRETQGAGSSIRLGQPSDFHVNGKTNTLTSSRWKAVGTSF
jgi:hypothetical protein